MNSLKNTLGVICFTILAFTATAQVSQEHAFQAMDNLLDGEWHLRVEFADGTKMEQQFKISKILKGKIYKFETYGNTSNKGVQQGLRNEGMRGWSKEHNRMEFAEADVFGGFVTGEVVIEGMDMLYMYEYAGQIMTDAWIYKGPNMYEYIVGVRNDRGQWTEMTMNGGITRKK